MGSFRTAFVTPLVALLLFAVGAAHAEDVSLVIPVHNEAGNLPQLIEEIQRAELASGRKFEVIFVDDHSSDETPRILTELAARNPSIRALRLPEQSGQAKALMAGIGQARAATIAVMDGDLQNDPADLPKMLDTLDVKRADMVVGWRKNRREGFVRRLSSGVGNQLARTLLGYSLHDMGCAIKVFRKEAIEGLPDVRMKQRYLALLTRMAGRKVVEVPVNDRPRVHGVAHYGLGRCLPFLADLYSLRQYRRR